MIVNIGICVSFLIVLFILSAVFFSKEKIEIIENSYFKKLILITIIGLSIESIIYYNILFVSSVPTSMYDILVKILYIYYTFWMFYFVLYGFVVFFQIKDPNEKKYKKFKFYMCIFYSLALVFCIVLPVEITLTDKYLYPYGIGTTFQYIFSTIGMTIIGICGLMNLKQFKKKESLPLIACMIFGVISIVVQYFFHEFLFIVPSHAIAVVLMYFTIENPDVKMVKQLVENRKIIERTSEEKSMFLFKMTQGLKEPIKNIDKQVLRYEQGNNKPSEVKEIITNIDQENGKMNYLVNDVIGIDSFDNNNIKKMENCYNLSALLNDIKIRVKNYIQNDIDFTFTVTKSIPKELMGDSIKLKQVFMSTILNSINHTKKGFVHVDVSLITKYDLCRIVMTIEDSGEGLELSKVNDILNQEEPITEQEYLKLEKLDIDLPLSYKIIKSLGGTMYIKSEVNKGTEITMTIDQYLAENKEEELNNKVDTYLKSSTSIKKVLVVDNSEEEQKKIKNILEKMGYVVSISMFGKDCVDRIKNKEKYDIILINDELSPTSGMAVLQELKTLKDKSKKIVMLEEDKLFIANHYLDDGFDQFIDKTKLQDELRKKV